MFWRDFNRNGNNFGRSWRSVWREMDRLQREMDRLTRGSRRAGGAAFPAVNVWSGKDGVLLTAEVPGVEPDDLDISIVGETLTLSGEHAGQDLQEGERYHRRERSSGHFDRTLQLPFRIDPEGVEASFNDGVLHITLPRAEEDKPKKITVKMESTANS
jgi:HSP20 family protein